MHLLRLTDPMPPSIRQQRQALRRQRRQQRQAQRKTRQREVSPYLSRRVRSSDLHSLDERQRRMAQAILSRRQQAQKLLERSREESEEDAAIANFTEPNQETPSQESSLKSQPAELHSSQASPQAAAPSQEQ